jgi:hypothetical protein
MQQISNQSTRSVSRPLIWLTLAVHLALGAYLYVKTTAPATPAAAPTNTEDTRP